MSDAPDLSTELEKDGIVVYVDPSKKHPKAYSFSFPIDCSLEKDMAKSLDLRPALERLGKALADQFNEKAKGERTADILRGAKPTAKRVIGVHFHRVEFSLIYAPGD